LQEFLARHQIKEKVLAVAVSGGADSLALVLMANEQLKVYGYKIVALTVNHQLRPTAGKEADYVAQVMQKHHIEHHILLWQGTKPSNGIEEAARLARYELMRAWCEQNGVKNLLVAHHLRDQAETFLMRLQRGSGLEGLSCMREVSEWHGLRILRPLLHCEPQTLRDYLQQKNIAWQEDESNHDKRYLRNRIRQFLPLLQQETGISLQKIATAVQNLQSAESYIEEQVELAHQQFIKQYTNEVFSIKYTDFLALHAEIKFRILARMCKKTYIPRAERILHVIQNLNKLPFGGATLGGKEIFIAYEQIWCVPELKAKHKATRKEWKDFADRHTYYKNAKIPHKARLAILQTEKNDDL